MHSLIQELSKQFIFRGRVAQDAPAFLLYHHCQLTAQHVSEVAREARRLAQRFNVDPEMAEMGGWLHDISAVIPATQQLQTSISLGLSIFPEEEAYPRILHQRLSAVIARELFNIDNADLLNAIEHHTTLRAHASPLEMVVFLADKIAWDQPTVQPFLPELEAGLRTSLEAGSLAYLDYLWSQRTSLRCIHPWMTEAREWLMTTP